MFFNLHGLIAAVLCVLAFKLAHDGWGEIKDRKRWIWLAISGMASLPAFFAAVYYLRVLPEWAWFYELRSWRGSEYFVVLSGVFAGAFAAALPRLLSPVVLFGLVVMALVPHAKPFLAPFPEGAWAGEWMDGVCLQSTPSTCGPASVATLLRMGGPEVSEAEVARAAHSYGGGTEAWYLARCVRSLGGKARFFIGGPGFESIRPPVMVGVKLGGSGHFIPVLAKDGDALILGDPLIGRDRVTMEEFRRRYEDTGFRMEIRLPGRSSKGLPDAGGDGNLGG